MNIDKKTIKFYKEEQEVSKQYELGEDVEITLKGSIIKQEIEDNQDGTVNLVYIFKPAITEIKDEYNNQ